MERQMAERMADLADKVEAVRIATTTRFDSLEAQLGDLNDTLAKLAEDRRKYMPGWVFYAFMTLVTLLAIGGWLY